jgi:hypothetical protein
MAKSSSLRVLPLFENAQIPSPGQSVNHVTGKHHAGMARPERFELPTTWFEARALNLTC